MSIENKNIEMTNLLLDYAKKNNIIIDNEVEKEIEKVIPNYKKENIKNNKNKNEYAPKECNKSISNSLHFVHPYNITDSDILHTSSSTSSLGETEYERLIKACECGNKAFIKKCIKNHVNINVEDEHGKIPLLILCKKGSKELIKMLIEEGEANVNVEDKNKDTPLTIYCRNKIVDLDILKCLIENGANINSINNNNYTPLTIYCERVSINNRIVSYLIENGANIIPESDNEVSVLNIAKKKNNKKLIELLTHKLKQNIDDDDTPLTFECKYGNIEKVEKLIKCGFDINEYNKEGDTPLTIACKINNIELVKCLLSNKSDVNQPSKYGFLPLIIACYLNNEEIVKCLIKNGADVNIYDNDIYHNTPLLIAKRLKYMNIEKVLINNRADGKIPDIEDTSYNEIIKEEKECKVGERKEKEKKEKDVSTKDDKSSINEATTSYSRLVNNSDLKKSICNVKTNNPGSGFFIKFPIPSVQKPLKILMTNNHVLDENFLKNEESFEIYFEEYHQKRKFEIEIKSDKFIFTSKLIDVTFIQLSDYEIEQINPFFLEPDDSENYENESIRIIQYPTNYSNEQQLAEAFGNIIEIDGFNCYHSASTFHGSSGSPLLNIKNSKVIGIHKGYINKEMYTNLAIKSSRYLSENDAYINFATKLDIVEYAIYLFYNNRNVDLTYEARDVAKELIEDEINILKKHDLIPKKLYNKEGKREYFLNNNYLFLFEGNTDFPVSTPEKEVKTLLFYRTNHGWYYTINPPKRDRYFIGEIKTYNWSIIYQKKL